MNTKQAINTLSGSEPTKTVWDFAKKVEEWVKTGENILFMTRSEADAMKEFIEQQEKALIAACKRLEDTTGDCPIEYDHKNSVDICNCSSLCTSNYQKCWANYFMARAKGGQINGR